MELAWLSPPEWRLLLDRAGFDVEASGAGSTGRFDAAARTSSPRSAGTRRVRACSDRHRTWPLVVALVFLYNPPRSPQPRRERVGGVDLLETATT